MLYPDRRLYKQIQKRLGYTIKMIKIINWGPKPSGIFDAIYQYYLDSNEPNKIQRFKTTWFNIKTYYMRLQPDTERDSDIENNGWQLRAKPSGTFGAIYTDWTNRARWWDIKEVARYNYI